MVKKGDRLVLLSGSHSRREDGKHVRYEAGDLLPEDLTADEMKVLADHVATIEDFELMIAEHEAALEAEAEAEKRKEALRRGRPRDEAAAQRAEKLRAMNAHRSGVKDWVT